MAVSVCQDLLLFAEGTKVIFQPLPPDMSEKLLDYLFDSAGVLLLVSKPSGAEWWLFLNLRISRTSLAAQSSLQALLGKVNVVISKTALQNFLQDVQAIDHLDAAPHLDALRELLQCVLESTAESVRANAARKPQWKLFGEYLDPVARRFYVIR